jgi:hypothetical protein
MKRALTPILGLLTSCLFALGCADGGVGGTGIGASATLQGNVEDVVANGAAAGSSGVWVAVQGTDVSDVTDRDGNFFLTGPIAGDRVLEFRERASEPLIQMNVTVLSGAVTTLKDVHFIRSSLRAAAEETLVNNVQLVVEQSATCSGSSGSLTAHPTSQADWTLTVLIDPETVIRRVSGSSSTPITCGDLTTGSEINVRGLLTDPREIQATSINRTKSGRPLQR